MANSKISALTAKTSFADTDEFPLVDNASTPETKKITGANLKASMARSQCSLRYDTFAGYGSTNNKIPYFTNKNTDTGTSGNLTITTNNATGGLQITINTAGLYAISFWANYANPSLNGISLNSNQLTTSIGSITASHRLGMNTNGASNYTASVSWSGWLAANDVIRPHTDGGAVGATPGNCGFTIEKL